MSWVLHRVDDRLIHGQVVVAWGQQLRPKRIWVVDDASAANAWERDLLATAAPGVEVRVVSVAEAAEAHAGEAAAEGAAFLLVRNLSTALALVDAGVSFTKLNLGGIHYAPGRTRVSDSIYLDAADRACARRLLERGVALEVQDVPASRPQPLSALDPEVVRA
jgi:mannose/fructose/N-acetylgalactosamine-specific phosphotransferase system component IIB